MGGGGRVAGFLSSPVLCLRFALIRKFSVSQDNAPPSQTAFADAGVPGPRSALGLEQGKRGLSSPSVWGEPCCGQSVLGAGGGGAPLAHKHIPAPLTLCRPEGLTEAAASFTWLSLER